jgi:6,7-dimethyl-8-ribityllumazine synthase
MNQMLQDTETKNPDTSAPPPLPPTHPRFAKPQRVAFVQSSWHREVVMECQAAFINEAEARNIPRSAIDVFEVPGSFEIPLHAQILAKTRRYTAIVAAGLVVDGGIYRHEFVADTVIKALMDVQLRTTKGIEVAEACANTLLSLERLRGQVAAGIVASA